MNTTRDCSIAAWKWMNESGNVSQNRFRVYAIFKDLGNLTGAEASHFYKSKYQSATGSEVVRNRISELMRMDAIEVVGTTIDPHTRMSVSVFGIVRDRMPRKFVARKSKAQLKIDELQIKLGMAVQNINGLITYTEEIIEANKDEIECRNDEDCDHCLCIAMIYDAKIFLESLKERG